MSSRLKALAKSAPLLLSLVSSIAAQAQTAAPVADRITDRPALLDYSSIHNPEVARHGMVASQDALASAAGVEIMKAGGNAVDAAIATGFALAVTLPRAGNLAGSGFMMIYDAKTKKSYALDFKDVAPIAAKADMFVKPDGTVDRESIGFTRKGAGVPGTVSGLIMAHERFGKLPLKQVIAPAVKLAREGFIVSEDLAQSLDFAKKALGADPAARKIFFRPDGNTWQAGDRLIQTDLARTMEIIAAKGADGFYKGEVAHMIADDMKRNGGLITEADLAAYKAVWREPVYGSYRGYDLALMPPPSSGGVHILQILNVLSHYPMKEFGADTFQSTHVMVEAMRQAYADRSEFMGDPDSIKIPVKWLTSQKYADEIAAAIPAEKARSSETVRPGTKPISEGTETTHYSIMDSEGNAVATTYSLNYSYGSGIVVPGTGALLNNGMDDFSAQPGTANAYGLVGGAANAIAPRKRSLSSMTPTIVFKDGKPMMVTGSPGGSRIITTVLQNLVNVIDFDMNIAEANATPRFHHQWKPDVVYLEPNFNKDIQRSMEAQGYKIDKTRSTMGSVQSVMFKDGVFYGSSDPRRIGAASIGY